MARVRKIDNSVLKRIQQKKEREKRNYRTKEKRERILIVCEGEQTEPNYFNAFEKCLPRGIVRLMIYGEGDNTINVVQSALDYRNAAIEKGNPFDQAWVVFDKDSFPAARFNDAIFWATSENIKCATSNEAFELWYLLHFEFYNTAITRTDYVVRLERYIGRQYRKNDPEMFDILNQLGDQNNAINLAKQLEQRFNGTNPATENPTTKVYKLVEALNKFLEEHN